MIEYSYDRISSNYLQLMLPLFLIISLLYNFKMNFYYLHEFNIDLWCLVWTSIITVILYLIYKIHFFDEIVRNYPDDYPINLRILPNQKQPPNYPNGWISILESRSIKANEVKSVQCFGQELAVIRGAKGQVYVIDAYCPHLGANLAIGGTVHQNDNDGNCKEDCIRCPFHGWSFRMSDGQCSNIPYEQSPNNSKVKIWTSLEINNAIFVWFHADNQEPNWRPDEVPDITNQKWVYRGRTEHLVNCHVQEIPENGADVAHLGEIHVDPIILGSELSRLNKLKKYFSNIFQHEWRAQWSACDAPNELHMSSIELVNCNRLFGYPLFNVNLKINQIGPAYVKLQFESNFLGGVKGVFMQYVKPIGPMRNSIVHQVYTENTWAGYIFGKFAIFGEAIMLERDIQIWNRKAFLNKPYLAKSEKALVKYRRWFTQFYSESSKRTIDW